MEKPKNIVIIIMDALRPKNLSLFGYKKETDKNLKVLAEESIVFNKFFSVSNSTFPSITSLFNGNYPFNHGIIHQAPYASPEEYAKFFEGNKFWLPKCLQENQYNTIAIDWVGLWFKEGFDYYGGEAKASFLSRFTKKPLVRKILLNLPSWAYRFGKKVANNKPLFLSSKEMVDFAIKKIKEVDSKPLFLFMHFEDTHFPYPNIPQPKLSGENDIEEVLKNIKTESQREYFRKRVVDINLKSIKDMKNKYDLAIEKIDFDLGRLMDFFKKRGDWKDTFFAVLSDHGDCLDEHEIFFSHAGLFEDSIHVPLIMKIPGLPHKKINEFAQTIDIAPTILDLIGYKNKIDLDGKSLFGLIKSSQPIREKVFMVDGLAPDVKAVRTKNRKLIVASGNQCNLCKAEHHQKIEEYDLTNDSEEKNNIFSGKSELSSFIDEMNSKV